MVIGRGAALSSLCARVKEGARLVTIAGMGGIGKTTLARALLGREPSAVFVPLARAEQMHEAAFLVARALEIRGDTDEQIRERLERRFARGAILVLDNVEHLPDAASTIDEWTREAPRLHVVATSRTRLGLPYEDVVELGPLAPAEAAQLFLRRAGMRAPSDAELADVQRIVEAVDGVPLAIELAAARTVPVGTLAARADDVRWLTGVARSGSARHRSIDDLFEWTWSRLDEASRRAMIELSAYRGGVSQALAEARFPELPALRAAGLVALSGDRYRMLEIVRAFVEARGDAAGARRRHAEQFAAEADARDALLPSNRAGEWLRSELENLAAAAASARAIPALALRTALALDAALTMSHLPRPAEALEAALAAGGSLTDRARATARLVLARHAEGRRDVTLASEAWALAERAGDVAAQTCAANALLRELAVCGRAAEAADIARRFCEPTPGLNPMLVGQVRAAALGVLPVRELASAYPRWLEAPMDAEQRTRELCRFALVLALDGQQERALEVVPPDGPDAAMIRGHVLLAAGRLAEASDAYGEAASVARLAGSRRSELWAALSEATVGNLAGRGSLERTDALVDALVELGSGAARGLICYALAGAPRARSIVAARRRELDALSDELRALDALGAGDRAALEDCARSLDARQPELPPTEALDVLLARTVLRARLGAPARRTLILGPELAWARLGDAPVVQFGEHHVLRRVLAALAASELDGAALFEEAWPGERASPGSARNRVRVALARLRKLGLESAIERGEHGWRLARDIDVVHRDRPH